MGRKNRTFDEQHSNSFGFSIKDVLSIKPRIEITGNTLATIDGTRGVLEYSENVIRVNMGNFSLKISGRGLTLKCISPTSLIVSGFIVSIEYVV